MKSDLRSIFDTSVLVSAVLLPHGAPRAAFDLAVKTGQVLVSEQTIAELNDVLRRPKFDKYVTDLQRLEFLAALLQIAELVEVHDVVTDCRDAKDNKFLELAISGNASHIITGDEDLLVLHPYRGVAIVSPQAFAAIE